MEGYMHQKVFVNRTLNLKKIQYIGLDMDHTLVRYNSHNFEQLAHRVVLKKLIEKKDYPPEIQNLPFEFDKAIRGLVLDTKNGNLLKLNRYSGIRMSQHGTKPIDFKTQKLLYKSKYIDLGDPSYYAIDTIFSISPALLYGQLVDLKDTQFQNILPNYEQLAKDVLECLDEAHRDGSIKNDVRKNVDRFIYKSPETVHNLEKYKRHGKKIFIITNSDFDYSKFLLDNTITPFLRDHKHWSELFEFVITSAHKPKFFYETIPFTKVDLHKGVLNEIALELKPGIYQGGCANIFTNSLNLSGDDILYIGDHIYGDILRLKKDCNWRTGLLVDEVENEILSLRKSKPIDDEINKLMFAKDPLERTLLQLQTAYEDGKSPSKDEAMELQNQIAQIDLKISDLIEKHKACFNPHWGEIMRIGYEESYFAWQVERFACIYMAHLNDLVELSPRTYFRGFRRVLPHESQL
jgi:HAD superfamily 5'-nucleotidase-like hydrolase